MDSLTVSRYASLESGRLLTYLSIITTLHERKCAGELVLYNPTVARWGPRNQRTLWLTRDAFQWCCPIIKHSDARVTDEALADLQYVLNSFVFRDDLEDEIDMRHLEPKEYEVWEFRSYVKFPRLRLFGSFALPSIFVGVNYRVRDDLELRRGPKWDSAIRDTRDAICNLFNGELPCSRSSFSDYLS